MTDVTKLKLSLIEILCRVGELEAALAAEKATSQRLFDLREEERRRYDELYGKYLAATAGGGA